MITKGEYGAIFYGMIVAIISKISLDILTTGLVIHQVVGFHGMLTIDINVWFTMGN